MDVLVVLGKVRRMTECSGYLNFGKKQTSGCKYTIYTYPHKNSRIATEYNSRRIRFNIYRLIIPICHTYKQINLARILRKLKQQPYRYLKKIRSNNKHCYKNNRKISY